MEQQIGLPVGSPVESPVGSPVGWSSRLQGRITTVLAAAGLMVFDPFGWDSFGPIRWLIIPALGFALIAVSLQQPFFRPLTRSKGQVRSIESILFAALLCWGFLAALFAVDRVHAWIGTPDRRFGWLTWLLCGGLFAVSRRLDESGKANVVRGFAVGAVGLGLYSFIEWLGVVTGSGPLWPAVDVIFSGGRVGGPFGQPAHLGAAAVLAAPISGSLAADVNASARWRAIGWLGAGLCGFAVLASQSRAAWLGALVAIALLIAAMPRARRLAAGSLMITTMTVAAVPALRERITGAFGDRGVIAGRTDEWQVGGRALADAPLLGYGPEGYRTVFGAHVDPEYVVAWGRDVITDRAHSGLLDVGLAFGIPGALLYSALAVLLLRAAWRAMRDGGAASGLGLGVSAYLLQQQFLFPLSEVDPLFWLAAGLLPALAVVPLRQPEGYRVVRTGQSLVAGLAIGLAIAVSLAGVADLAANIRINQVLTGDVRGQTAEAVGSANTLRPDSIRYRFIGSRLATQQGDLESALQQIDNGLDISPGDPALGGEQARLRLEMARETPDGIDRTAAIRTARTTLEALILVDPNHPEHLQRLGIARALDGDVEDAIAAMERAVLLAPDRQEPKQNLAELLRLRDET